MAPILWGIALGAAGAFLLDPQHGRRRRALLRDKLNRAQGLAARASALTRRAGAPDDVLVKRVRASLGRNVSHPKAIKVTAQAGCIVLSGDILAKEHSALLRALYQVRGVKEVDDRLDVHLEPDNIPSLQA